MRSLMSGGATALGQSNRASGAQIMVYVTPCRANGQLGLAFVMVLAAAHDRTGTEIKDSRE